ncbi:hypothetical protein JW960_28755 [candidate division KSB1 bacterium]|nr:hypothetical protein [candidate division KSB1 bacterium]
MPDAFTHIAIPSLFHRYIRRPIIVPLFLIGTVLPDYLRQAMALIFPMQYSPFILIFHTFIGACLTTLIITAVFHVTIRKLVFLSIFLGQCCHFAVDMLQGFLCGGKLYLLFPWTFSFETGLISESKWLEIFVFSVIVFSGYWGWYLWRRLRTK